VSNTLANSTSKENGTSMTSMGQIEDCQIGLRLGLMQTAVRLDITYAHLISILRDSGLPKDIVDRSSKETLIDVEKFERWMVETFPPAIGAGRPCKWRPVATCNVQRWDALRSGTVAA
jgi:hypothetical protein